ncbi:response regulator [Myxococcota bacterium]|nr:response regulator [Myxococcota bacterium]
MSAPEPQLDRVQQRQFARFERMGLSCRAMPGGRTLLVSLPTGAAPFESPTGPLSIERILFSTVGADQIKCLRPRPLFNLPLLDIRRCADAGAIEAVIRQAWRDRTRELRETGRTLRNLGIEVGVIEGGSLLAFPLSGESPDRPVLMHSLDEAILPTAGPLSGHRLAGVEERVVDVSGKLVSAAELDLLLGSRVESLARSAIAREAADRRPRLEAREPVVFTGPLLAASPASAPGDPAGIGRAREPRVLLVGARLVENAPLREELKRQGYRIATARSEPEALMRLAGTTPDLVLSQYGLGRSDGATFVQAIRDLPGIVRIPVVLLDDVHHQSRQDAARAVGAAGYVIEPVEATRFVTKLRKLAISPGDRRFTRYAGRLAARLAGQTRPCVATEIGRGGVFIATTASFDGSSDAQCEVALPELHRSLAFVGEILYRSELQGVDRQGIGVRIQEISPEDEAALIAYVTLRERQR